MKITLSKQKKKKFIWQNPFKKVLDVVVAEGRLWSVSNKKQHFFYLYLSAGDGMKLIVKQKKLLFSLLTLIYFNLYNFLGL